MLMLFAFNKLIPWTEILASLSEDTGLNPLYKGLPFSESISSPPNINLFTHSLIHHFTSHNAIIRVHCCTGHLEENGE